MKTKALLGAIVVAVLAVMGVVGFQQTKDTEAGYIFGISGLNGTTMLVGNTSDFTITFFDDNGTTAVSANVQAGAGLATGNLTSVVTSCSNGTIYGNGTPFITLFDAGTAAAAAPGPQPTPATAVYTAGVGWNTNPGQGCDTPDTNGQQYTWTIRFTCTAVGNVSIFVWAPSTFAGAPANGGGWGSLSPGLPGNQTAQPGLVVLAATCVATNIAGNNGSTISIRKVDQFGQPMQASFSIQASPFWVEVARVNLFNTIAQNPCATDGTAGTFGIPNAGATCSNVGVITGGPGALNVPNPCTLGATCAGTFPNGLPAGQYRIVEILQPNSWCTLVQVYNGNQSANQSNTLPFSGAMLTQPVLVNLPDANPLDLQITFVNSCIVPGGPSTATSQIAIVIGGSTPGLVNTSNVEIVPAPGSDDDYRGDIRIRDAASIPIPNAHVTILVDKGAIAVRRDLSSFPQSGYDVLEPTPAANYASPFSGDTCDQANDGFLQQSTVNGNYGFPFNSNSRQQQDGYTDFNGFLSFCGYVDTMLAPGTTPGKINIQAIVESPGQGGLYSPGLGFNPYYGLGNDLSLPNYLATPNIVLTATVTVVGPPASITVAAAPTSLNCGEKATITVTVKDSAGQNVSDRTRVELVTNFGGVIGGTTATLGPTGITGGQVYPISSSSAETFNGVATAYLLTSTDHVGPYEVVAAAGGSVMASNGFLAPWYGVQNNQSTFFSASGAAIAPFGALTPFQGSYFPWYNQGMLSYSPSSAPVNAQATVTCAVPGAPAAGVVVAPPVVAPRTGQGPADAFAIRPPNTGDAGLAATSGSSSWTLVAGALMVIAISGAAAVKVTRR